MISSVAFVSRDQTVKALEKGRVGWDLTAMFVLLRGNIRPQTSGRLSWWTHTHAHTHKLAVVNTFVVCLDPWVSGCRLLELLDIFVFNHNIIRSINLEP